MKLGEDAQQDHRHLSDAIAALFADAARGLDGAVIRALAGGPVFGAPPDDPAGDEAPRAFPRFGLYVWRTGRAWLAVRCGALAGGGFGAHVHNDQLSFELALDGVPIFVDCGAYLYSPLAEQRNRFRSAALHNVLSVAGHEQFRPGSESLFHLVDTARPRVIEAGPSLFVGEHQGYGAPCRRTIRLGGDGIAVEDSCAASGAKSVHLHLHPSVRVAEADGALALAHGAARLTVTAETGAWRVEKAAIATGYGRLAETHRLVLPVAGDGAAWRVRFES